MKRPICAGVVFLLSGAVLGMYSSILMAGLVALLELLVLFIFCRKKQLHVCYFVYGIVCAITMLSVYNQTSQKVSKATFGKNFPQVSSVDCVLLGKVFAVAQKEGYVQLQLKGCTASIKGTDTFSDTVLEDVGFLVTGSRFSGTVGDVVRVEGTLEAFRNRRNEGEFDSERYYHSIGLDYPCQAKVITIETDEKKQKSASLYASLFSFQEKVSQVYEQVLIEKEAGILSSVVLGEKSMLDPEVKSLYQTSGIAHLLAISGLHISMIGFAVYKGFRRIFPFLPAAVMSAGVMIAYDIMTGSGISAFRALVMFLLAIGAEVMGRTYDFKTALAVAAILLILEDGRVISNTGFQLSFSALLGIGYFYPALKDLLHIPEKKTFRYQILNSVLVSISIQFTTLPVILWSYYQVPVFGFLLNLIVIPLMSLVMVSGILGGLIGLFSLQGAGFFLGMAHYILTFYEGLCVLYMKLEKGVIVVGKPTGRAVLIYVLILMVCCLSVYMKRKCFLRNSMLLLLLIGLVQLKPMQASKLMVTMMDVGQGDSIFVRTVDGLTCLFDGGSTDIKKVGEKRILPYLKSQGVSELDYIFVSHSDADHINGIMELIHEQDCSFSIKQLVLPDIAEEKKDDSYIALEQAANSAGISVAYTSQGDAVQYKDFKIACIYPEQGLSPDSANNGSAVYVLSYKNFKMLFTGDAEEEAEEMLLRDVLNTDVQNAAFSLCDVDVLKVGHHGSSSSSSEAFLECIQPEAAMISCGIDNAYGHPHEQTLNNLKNRNCKTYITNTSGAITIMTDGSAYQIRTFLKNKR